MRLGIVSDTHGQVLFARNAVRMLESLDVDLVIHCGDIGSPEVVALFSDWPTHFVFGNVDLETQRLRSAIEAPELLTWAENKVAGFQSGAGETPTSV